MIKQIAVAPEVMATWVHFREIWADCGVDQGRLLSEYPKDWREQVCRHAQTISPIKAASISAKLKPPPGQRTQKRCIPSHRSYDKGKDWLNNTEQSEEPEPFHFMRSWQKRILARAETFWWPGNSTRINRLGRSTLSLKCHAHQHASSNA